MTRPIDAKALKARLEYLGGCDAMDDWSRGYDDGVSVAMEAVDAQPTIDTPTVRHGRWIWEAGYLGTMAVCSVCGKSPMGFYSLPKSQIGRLPEYPYCPKCGAKMDAHIEDDSGSGVGQAFSPD